MLQHATVDMFLKHSPYRNITADILSLERSRALESVDETDLLDEPIYRPARTMEADTRTVEIGEWLAGDVPAG
jgi:hypothetical protein